MTLHTSNEDLIDVVVRLPRVVIEQSLRTTPGVAEFTPSTAYLTVARAVLASRSHRKEVFHGLRFGEPCWDMILELYVAVEGGRTLNVTKFCAAGGRSATTGLRHLEEMEEHGYVLRTADGSDARSNLVVMQPALRQAVEIWLGYLTDLSTVQTSYPSPHDVDHGHS